MAAKGNPEFRRFLAAPESWRPVILLYGNDQAVVDACRRAVVAQSLKHAARPMRVTRADGAELSADPTMLIDLFREESLFEDVALLEISDVSERHADVIRSFLNQALDPPKDGARAVLGSHQLKAKSKLIAEIAAKPFAIAVACYDAAMGRADIRAALADRGVSDIEDEALELLVAYSGHTDPMTFETLLEKAALYTEAGAALGAGDLRALEGDIGGMAGDDIALALLGGDRQALLDLYLRRQRGAEDATAFLLALGRSIGDLLAACRPGGGRAAPRFWKVDKALEAARRRAPDIAQRLERCLRDLYEVEKRSRGLSPLPAAEIERLTVKIAHQLRV